LTGFRTGEVKVLVATDIAARGLDIPAVSHIFNYELPNVPEQYVHRIGRTARAGREGRAIALCAPDERPYLKDIERTIRMTLDVAPLPANFRDLVGLTAKLIKSSPAAAEPPREERDFARGRGGARPGRDARAVVHADGRAPRRDGGRDMGRDATPVAQAARPHAGRPDDRPYRVDGYRGQRPAGGRAPGRPHGNGGGFGGQRGGQRDGSRRSPAGR
jgi:ATP-dependent RNA helicase RhlE